MHEILSLQVHLLLFIQSGAASGDGGVARPPHLQVTQSSMHASQITHHTSSSPQWTVIARNDAAPCKYIYVARNPKDTCVSLYHHMVGFKGYQYQADWDCLFSEMINMLSHYMLEL